MNVGGGIYLIGLLLGDATIVELTGGRVYYVARDNVAEEKDRVPYVVVAPTGVSLESDSKDMGWDEWRERFVITLCAETGAGLKELVERVAEVIENGAEGAEEAEGAEGANGANGTDWGGLYEVRDMEMSGGPVNFDPMKPCYWQQIDVEIVTEKI